MWEPYQYIDEQGNVTGLDIELVTAIVENAGCRISLLQLPWKRHLKAVENGAVDIAAGASKTTERQAYAYYTKPYREEVVALFIKTNEQHLFKQKALTELLQDGFRLGISRGNFYGSEFETLMENPENRQLVQEVNSYVLNYHKLLNNRIDGFLSDRAASFYTLKKQNIADAISPHPIPVYSTNIYLMLSKASTDKALVERLNNSLDELKANGTYQKILDKYLN